MDGGVQTCIYRVLPGDRAAVIDLDPGIIAGAATEWKEQTLRSIWLNSKPQPYAYGAEGTKLTFDSLDDIQASELLRDIHELVR